MSTAHVTWVQGDSNDLRVQVLDPDSTPDNPLPYNITNAKLWLVAKRRHTDADEDAVVYVDTGRASNDPLGGITKSDPDNGYAVCSMALDALAGLTAPCWLYYAVQVRTDGGKVWEVVSGTATVLPGIVAAVA